jgi:hypothetical protein
MESGRPVVPSHWIRLVEYTFFAIGAIAASISALLFLLSEYASGLVSFIDADSMGRGIDLLIGGIVVVFVVFSIAWAVALYFDAKRLSAAELDWSPSPVLYAVGALFTAIVPLYYLYRRHEYVRMPIDFDRWWYVVTAFVGLSIANLLATVLILSGVGAMAVGFELLGLVITVVVPLLPIAIYRDAAHVRTNGDGWKPNPVAYLVAVTVGLLVPLVPLALLASGYYLCNRHRHVGLPRP